MVDCKITVTLNKLYEQLCNFINTTPLSKQASAYFVQSPRPAHPCAPPPPPQTPTAGQAVTNRACLSEQRRGILSHGRLHRFSSVGFERPVVDCSDVKLIRCSVSKSIGVKRFKGSLKVKTYLGGRQFPESSSLGGACNGPSNTQVRRRKFSFVPF